MNMRSISARKRGNRRKTYTITHYAIPALQSFIMSRGECPLIDALVIVEFYFILKKFYHLWLFTYNNLYLMDRLKS